MLEQAWTGYDYTGLDGWLLEVVREIDQVAGLRYSHPLVHYTMPPEHESLPVAIAVLDDTTSLLMTAVPPDERPPAPILHRLRKSIDRLLESLPKAGFEPSAEAPPLPGLSARLDGRRAALVDGFALLAERRRMLLGWVKHEGRQWPGARNGSAAAGQSQPGNPEGGEERPC